MGLLGIARRRRGSDHLFSERVRLYYASDVHGSERCWRKFLGAGRFYKADALIMGGDLTGKAVVPIVMTDAERWETTFLGDKRVVTSQEGLSELMVAVRDNGMYPWVAGADEIERHRADDQLRSELFARLIDEEVARWVEIADERLDRDRVEGFVIAGNDDPWSVDAVLDRGQRLVACEPRVVKVGPHEMVSCAFANPTPWHSPRELDEDALYVRLKDTVEHVEDLSNAIFNFHVPPYDSGLDTAQQLTDDLVPVYRNGNPVEIPVGSTAVRAILEEYQPLLSLHGHIHESRNSTVIGRTLALNSGSEYNSGRIHGALITLGDKRVESWQFVVG